MATASEGKTTDEEEGSANPLCDACEDKDATKFCLICPGPLCDDCTRSHMKLKLTRDHKICDLSLSRLGSSQIRSGEPLEGLSKCPKHGDKEMEHFCKDCTCLICTDCKSSHVGHEIQMARDDISVHRTVYHDHMKKMLDENHDLEQYKISLEKGIQKYEDTCLLVDEKADNLIEEIKENAKRLKGELRTVQGELKQILGDTQNGLIKEMDYAYNEILKLQNFRKTNDCGILSHALASSRCALDKMSDYKHKITPQAKTLPNEKILPYENEIDSINYSVRLYFVMPLAIKGYSNATMVYTSNVNNPKGDQGYRFIKSPIEGNLVIHSKSAENIRLLGNNYKEHTEISGEFGIWNMVKVHHDEYIAIKTGGEEISLLDDNFKILTTLNSKRIIRSICYYDLHQFVMGEEGTDKAVYFSIMLVKDKKIVKQSEINVAGSGFGVPWYMELYPDKERCLVSGTSLLILYIVNLTKSTFTKHDVSAYINKRVWGLFVDDHGNALVADEKGNIHKFDETMNHELIAKIGTGDTAVRDVMVRNNHLLVSSWDNKIYVYS